MFGVDSTELAVVAILALIFIGPKDLPKVLRTVGYWVGRVRGMARHFTSGIENMMREAELEEMEKKWREENERIMQLHPAEAYYPEPEPEPPWRAPAAARRRAARRPRTSRPKSGRCREGYRRDQAAPARASDRASAAASVVPGDAGRHLLRLLRISPRTSSRCWSSRCSRRARASSSTPTFSRPFSSR